MSVDLNKLMETYGSKGLLIGIFIMILGWVLNSKWFGDIWLKLSEKVVDWFIKKRTNSDIKQIKESDIINHDIFNYIDFWKYSKVPTFTFSTKYRTIVFRKYLSIYLKSYKDVISKFIIKGEYKKMDEAELAKSFFKMINDIVYDYELECDKVGIPKIVIEKMKQKNNETIQLLMDLIKSITGSQFYQSDNNYLKVYSVLNIILSVMENTISSSEDTCNSINGQLRGLSMDGETEP
jgi:hypothetical protein